MNGNGASQRIQELLARVAEELGDVDVVETGKAIEYRRGGVVFAASAAEVVEIRLGEEIADAAARTPSTTISGRGPDWVSFAPPEWDGHAVDRLDAWFRVAWRTAGRSRR